MSQSIQINGQTINYPETGDTNWSDDATNFAIQTSAALGKIGLSSGTSVDITQTLDVTGNTTLDSNLSVGGNTTLTGNLTVNGNTQLGNANTDTIGVTGIVNIDSGVLYVDPVNNRVGINDTTPSEALDVTGNALVSGTLGVSGDVSVNTNKFNITASSGNTSIAGTLGVTGDVAINTNKFNITASSGDTTIGGTLFNSNGSSSLPSISFSSDNDNGFYYIGSNNFGISVGGSKVGEFNSSGLMITVPYWNIVDQKASGTSGGNTVASTWTKRTLNTTQGSNTITGSSLSSDVIILPAGTYRIFATSIFVGGNTKIRIRNTTDGATVIVGTSLTSTSSQTANNVNTLSGTFTIASTKNFELQYWASNVLTNGLGIATSSGEVEIYSIVELWRLA